jgi:hypothetical protein
MGQITADLYGHLMSTSRPSRMTRPTSSELRLGALGAAADRTCEQGERSHRAEDVIAAPTPSTTSTTCEMASS